MPHRVGAADASNRQLSAPAVGGFMHAPASSYAPPANVFAVTTSCAFIPWPAAGGSTLALHAPNITTLATVNTAFINIFDPPVCYLPLASDTFTPQWRINSSFSPQCVPKEGPKTFCYPRTKIPNSNPHLSPFGISFFPSPVFRLSPFALPCSPPFECRLLCSN
jgi:hypothetical protein